MDIESLQRRPLGSFELNDNDRFLHEGEDFTVGEPYLNGKTWWCRVNVKTADNWVVIMEYSWDSRTHFVKREGSHEPVRKGLRDLVIDAVKERFIDAGC